MTTPPGNPEVGLVLAGGGARGAYEIGALRELLPYLEARGERPGIIVGTSIGALNSAFLAASSDQPATASLQRGVEMWEQVRYRHICGPFASVGQAARLASYVGELARVPRATV